MSRSEIKILLVDDEVQFVDTLAERLGMRGFTAQVAYSGDEALRLVGQGTPPDVMVLDLRMPDMNGPEVTERGHQEPTRAVPADHTENGTVGDVGISNLNSAGRSALLGAFLLAISSLPPWKHW